MRVICLCLLFLIAIVVNVSADLSCKDEDNNDVDWWFMYLQDDDDEKYFYVTSENYNKWQMSNETLMSNRSLLFRGLNLESIEALVSYNDVLANGTTFDWGGASRGWLAASRHRGIWIIYSMPLDVNLTQAYGDHYLCLALDEKGVEKAAKLFLLIEPHFNLTYRSYDLVNISPLLNSVIGRNTFMTGDLELDVELSTLKGRKFRLFGKSPSIYKELYADIVAPALGVNLFVRTDRNSCSACQNLPNKCNDNKIYNIKEVVGPQGRSISALTDHSKWAVSQKNSASDWICIGDLDRHQSHLSRGGTAICLEDSVVSERYRELIYSYEECQ
ncbi:plancitoxin-1-like [Drosophila sulfurigaster albostrigata]|uniref:plancitoxin-1-like n=1 Tax=Drosophila sulfurigaster albostrigata TaxID=89887 RepID=UPI002D21DAA9|nr:plancitoxin-1-like [Drosophila sulfurigaster albostrigata]XP_062122414.1 plancitoxin-1-like [Drosophila sulfurigaster albostrigata]